MKVLFLGPGASQILAFLSGREEVVRQENSLELSSLTKIKPELIVSHGYRHIIRADVLNAFPHRVINLHISLLPWNRGADPNFWSFFDNTPKGVTIHEVDAGLDTGPILCQQEVEMHNSHTLKTSYELLQRELLALFQNHWTEIKAGTLKPSVQPGEGSFHRKRDLESFHSIVADAEFETPVQKIIDAGRRFRSGDA